jgi:hypothetical protein
MKINLKEITTAGKKTKDFLKICLTFDTGVSLSSMPYCCTDTGSIIMNV